MFVIAVCDDEARIAEFIAGNVRKRFESKHIPVRIDVYTDARKLEKKLNEGEQYQVLLLDIDMPGLDGLSFCRSYRAHNGDSLIVFISNKEALVFQTFDVQPFRFIRKSHFSDEIDGLCTSLIQELNRRNEQWIRLESEGTVDTISINRLFYVEAEGKYCSFHQSDVSRRYKVKLTDIEIILSGYSFILVHRSYLVNPAYIFRIDMDCVLLDNGESIPLSRNRRNEVKDAYFKWSVCE